MNEEVCVLERLAFHHSGERGNGPALKHAIDRGWITESGVVTMEGREVVQAMSEQNEYTVYRQY